MLANGIMELNAVTEYICLFLNRADYSPGITVIVRNSAAVRDRVNPGHSCSTVCLVNKLHLSINSQSVEETLPENKQIQALAQHLLAFY